MSARPGLASLRRSFIYSTRSATRARLILRAKDGFPLVNFVVVEQVEVFAESEGKARSRVVLVKTADAR